MITFGFGRCALGIATVAIVAACGMSQGPIGHPGVMPLTNVSPRHSSGYELLYSFRGGPDGEYPAAGLVFDGGLLYGTTFGAGCSSSCAPGSAGTVFSMSPSGQEQVIYDFKGAPDAGGPTAPLLDLNGTLYGTTQLGGTHGYGTVFAVTTSGSERIVYSFRGGSDGAGPFGSVIGLHGRLYGVTEAGGGSGCRSFGCGTVFGVSTSGDERVVYSFKGYPHDGELPTGSLVAVKGLLYGATWIGGGGGCNTGCGTIFEVNTSGNEHVLHSFKGAPDGENPPGGLVALNGVLYGTTATGGASTACPAFHGCGTVFDVTTSGKERVLYNFKGGRDVAQPNGELISVNRLLYGTGAGGAKCAPSGRCGTVFSVSTSGLERVLYRFKGYPDGAFPGSPLVAVSGMLYDTTAEGGANRYGSVFKLRP